jgi:hypothetical protein
MIEQRRKATGSFVVLMTTHIKDETSLMSWQAQARNLPHHLGRISFHVISELDPSRKTSPHYVP